MPYVTHAELAENPGALELSEVASDEHARPVAAELLDALLRGQDVAAWSPEDVAAGQRALVRIDDAQKDTPAGDNKSANTLSDCPYCRLHCWCRSNLDHLCRFNSDQGLEAELQ